LIHPSIRDLFLALNRHPAFQDAVQRLRTTQPGAPVQLSGLTLTAKAIYSVLLSQTTGRPLLIVTDGSKEAEELTETIDTFFDLLLAAREHGPPQLLPALDVLPFQGLSPHAEILAERALGLLRLATQRAPITVAPILSALLKVERADFYRQLALTLRLREEIALADLAAHLDSIGYQRREPVEMVGEYSIRGGIVDIFSPEASHPVRIELFGDEIESIRRFEVETQRSVLKLESCTLLPLTEYPKPSDEATQPGWEFLVSLKNPRTASILSLLEKPIVVWDEPEQIRSAAERSWVRLDQTPNSAADRIYFRWEELLGEAARLTSIEMRELSLLVGESDLRIATRPAQAFHGT
jgi:transcription-repair coupling factor (superfamily II helicase)